VKTIFALDPVKLVSGFGIILGKVGNRCGSIGSRSISGIFVNTSANDFVKGVYYIRSRDSINSKLNSKYLDITLSGPKEDIIAALAEKARRTEM